MKDLIRRWRGEGGMESYGVSQDGLEISSVLVRRLSAGRIKVELADKPQSNFWLTARKDLAFMIRHVRVPTNFSGSLYKLVLAEAQEIFKINEEKLLVRTDGIRDPDGVLFVHGMKEAALQGLVRDFHMVGIDAGKAAGFVPQSVALQRACELLEQRSFSGFTVIWHLGHTGDEVVGIRGGRPVFYRDIYRLTEVGGETASLAGVPGAVRRSTPVMRRVTETVNYLETHSHFGAPAEVILTGPFSNQSENLDTIRAFFPKSDVRHLKPSKHIVSESISEEDIRTHALSIGAAMAGLDKNTAHSFNFLEDQKLEVESRTDSIYDKIILACGAAMFALAFVTANAFFLDLTKSRLTKITENQKTIESLRGQLRNLEPELESASHFLNVAAVRFDSLRSKTFSIPASVAKLLSAVESAAPDGVTLDKIESGWAASAAQGRYSNFFRPPGTGEVSREAMDGRSDAQGEPVSIVLSGRAALPDDVIFFQDALRDQLGVSVDIASMGREGDFWARKPVNFVIVLRGSIRRA